MSVGVVYYLQCNRCGELLEKDDCPFFYDTKELYRCAREKNWPVLEAQIEYRQRVQCPECFTKQHGVEWYRKVCKDIVEFEKSIGDKNE